MEGSSFSSPLESPEVPITSSAATLQSAESLSFRRQVRLCSDHCNEPPQTQAQLAQTPDTPSANISPQSSSEQSQAFTSHFNSENSLLLPKYYEPQSPSAILTSSTEISSEARYSSSFKFHEEPWDLENFDYDLSSLNIDGMSIKSCQSNE